MAKARHYSSASAIAIAVVWGATGFGVNGARADALLAGTITSAAGEKMGGVTVSAKAEGSTITTSVYTDEAGGYYFPALPEGKYRVWAQALTFHERAKAAHGGPSPALPADLPSASPSKSSLIWALTRRRRCQ